MRQSVCEIQSAHVVLKLNLSRKLLLGTAACLAIALPIAYGLFTVTPSRAESSVGSIPKFTSVTIKPHPASNNGLIMTKMMMKVVGVKADDNAGFMATNVSLHTLIQNAYRIQETQLTGEPEWMKTDRYDINATLDPSAVEQMRGLNEKQREIIGQQMLQQLLADYFKVTLHQESRDLPIYELVAAEGGVKLQKASDIGMESKEHSLYLRDGIVTQEEQRDLDKLGIAKNAREEKIRARDAKLKAGENGNARGPQKNDEAYNARMAALYREVVLKEKPAQSENGFLPINALLKPNGNGNGNGSHTPEIKPEVAEPVSGD